jgi:hypothetical protein
VGVSIGVGEHDLSIAESFPLPDRLESSSSIITASTLATLAISSLLSDGSNWKYKYNNKIRIFYLIDNNLLLQLENE